MSIADHVPSLQEQHARLVERFRNGEQSAFSLLLSECRPMIIAKSSRYISCSADADDLLQECALGVLDATYTFDADRASFMTYASRCVENRLVSFARTLGRQKNRMLNDYVPIDEDTVLADICDQPEYAIMAKAGVEMIKQSIASALSKKEYSVLSLRMSGCTYAQIGQRLGMSEKAVGNALARARKKLQNELDAQ